MFVVATSIFLNGCVSTLLLNKQPPQILGVKQKLSKIEAFPDEYVFCDMQKGAWRCPDVSPKTLLSENVEKQISHAKLSDESETFALKSELTKHFDYSDIAGEPLGKVHFPFDSHLLTDHSKDALSYLLPKLIGKPVLLFGFTDNVGIELYNDDLAFNRAKSVKKFLVENGILESEIHVEGNGICCYLVPNGTDEQRKINRRVEVYLAD